MVAGIWGIIGNTAQASNNSALVTGTGSLWTNSDQLYVGYAGSCNSMTISNGGKVAGVSGFIGNTAQASNNSAFVTGAGSLWTNSANLYVGFDGRSNSLTISDGGSVNASSIRLAEGIASSATLNIGRFGTNDAGGTIAATTINVGSGTGVINFNQSNAVTLASQIMGRAILNQLGSGITTLSGNNTYTGGTTINAGRLVTTTATALGTGNVTVNGGVLAPAIGPALQVGGNLSFGPAGGYGWQLLANSAAGAGTNFTAPVNLAGNLSVATNATFEIDLGGTVSSGDAFWSAGTTNSWTVIESTNPLASGLNFTPVWSAGSITTGFNLSRFSFTTNSSGLVLRYTTPATALIATPGQTMVNGTSSYPNVTYEPSGRLLVNLGGNLTITNPVIMSNNSTTTVNGTFTSPGGFRILNGSMLMGSGILNGDLINGGLLSPGNSPGTMTINGNYTQTSGGTLAIEVGIGVYDRLVVNGIATLAGTLAVSTVDGGTLALGDKYQFLTASGGITGTFDSIAMPSGFRGRFLPGNANTQGTLLVAPQSYTQVAVTPNEVRVAGALDAFIPATSGDRFTASVALDELTAAQYPPAFEAVMPSIYASIPTLAFNQANALNTSMFQRMWMQRISGTGFSSSGMAMEPMQTHLQTAAADKTTVLPVEPDRKNWAAFADGNGIFATANSGGALQDYRSQSGGVTAGASYKWNDNFATGIYAGYQGLVAQYDGGNRLTDNAVRFGGFGTVGFGGWYANGLVGGAYHSYDVSRNIEFGTVNRTARGKPGAGEFDLALATGYDFKVGRFTFGPSTSMQYTYLAVQGFNETGADSLNLGVQGYNPSSLLYSLGAQVAYRWEMKKIFAVTPMLSANWQHEFMQNAYPINAAFNTGGPSTPFFFQSSQPQQDYFYAGAGLGFDFGDTWGASFFYNAAAGNQDLVSHNIYLSIGAKF